MTTNKIPPPLRGFEHQFGIEIETIGGTRPDALRLVGECMVKCGYCADYTVRKPDSWTLSTESRLGTWKAVYDLSVGGPGESVEIVSPILTLDDLPLLREILHHLDEDPDFRVNGQCGVHIHVDARDLTTRQISNLTKMVLKQEALIYAALDVNARRENHYVRQLVDDSDIKSIVEDPGISRWRKSDLSSELESCSVSRYHGLNLLALRRHGSIEYRWFNGTLDAETVEAYIYFVLCLTERARVTRHASSKRRELRRGTGKHDMRCFLRTLGMDGEWAASARKILLANLDGHSGSTRGAAQPVARPTALRNSNVEQGPTLRASIGEPQPIGRPQPVRWNGRGERNPRLRRDKRGCIHHLTEPAILVNNGPTEYALHFVDGLPRRIVRTLRHAGVQWHVHLNPCLQVSSVERYELGAESCGTTNWYLHDNNTSVPYARVLHHHNFASSTVSQRSYGRRYSGGSPMGSIEPLSSGQRIDELQRAFSMMHTAYRTVSRTFPAAASDWSRAAFRKLRHSFDCRTGAAMILTTVS